MTHRFGVSVVAAPGGEAAAEEEDEAADSSAATAGVSTSCIMARLHASATARRSASLFAGGADGE